MTDESATNPGAGAPATPGADPEPVAWRGLIYGTPVLASDGARVGSVREVLGSDEEDIFHGLRVELDAAKRDVMIRADDIDLMSDSGVRVGLTATEIEGLPTYDDEATYHLASVGWLRSHLGRGPVSWKRDSKSDEEAG
jgi:hypothetical protein